MSHSDRLIILPPLPPRRIRRECRGYRFDVLPADIFATRYFAQRLRNAGIARLRVADDAASRCRSGKASDFRVNDRVRFNARQPLRLASVPSQSFRC